MTGYRLREKSEFSVKVPIYFPDAVPAPIGVLILAVKTLQDSSSRRLRACLF